MSAEAPMAPSSPSPVPAITSSTRTLSMVAILLCTLMATLDASIVNVALPQLSRTLHATPDGTVWVTTAFLLAVACAVPTTSALGDQFGRRRLFLVGVPIFTLASLGCALSPTLGVLIAFRVVQGLGSAALLAVAIPLFRVLFPPEKLGQILGINAMVVAMGTCAGPTLGGVILAVASWPWLFLINVPIGAFAFALAAWKLPLRKPERGNFDLAGALLAASAIVLFLLGMHRLASVSTLWVAGLLLAGFVVFLVLFIARERRATRPAIPLGLFTGVFTLSAATAFASFLGQGIAFVALPFLFQSAYGATPLESALLFTPWPFVIIFVAPLSGRLADRFRPSTLALVGLTIFTISLALLALLGSHPPTWLVLVETGLAGLGFGIFQSPNNRDMQSAVPMKYASAGAGMLNLNRTLGQSTGSGLVSVCLTVAGAVTLSQQADAATAALWIAAACALVAVIVSAAKLRAVVVSRAAA